ncbi:MAG: glycosyltransferase family 39 protein [Caldilineaceae bacterium]
MSLLLLGAFLRFYTIGVKTIWLDEAFSIWLSHHTLLDLWGWLIKIDQHPPLYYTLLHFWQQLFGDLQGAVRALSALCSTLAIPCFYAAGRRLFDRAVALVATLLLVTAPFHVRYAQETRMYALLTLAVAMALYLLARLLFEPVERQPRWLWPAFGVTQAAVMWTHNTAAIFFPLALNLAIGGAVFWQHGQGGVSSLPALNWPDFERRWLRTQLLALICWLPWSVPFLIQSLGVVREFWIPFPNAGIVYETLHNFHLAHQPESPVPWLLGDLLYWGLGIIGIWSLRRRGALLALLFMLFSLPIGGEWLVSLRRPIFSDRTLIWVTLPYYLLVAAGVIQLERWGSGIVTGPVRRYRGQLVAGCSLLALLTLNGQALANYYSHFAKEGWDEAAAYVADQAEPNDLLLFHATWVQLPFDYYFRHTAAGDDATIVRHGVPVDLFDRGILEPKMAGTDIPQMQQIVAGHDRVWLIYSHDWYTDPQGILPRALGRQRQLVAQRQFRGVRVLLYQPQLVLESILKIGCGYADYTYTSDCHREFQDRHLVE